MPELKPCVLERTIQTKVWGGRALHGLFGITGSGAAPIGETWELFDRPEGSSAIRGGGTLRQLMASDPAALLGRGVRPGYGGRFPLLFKFLDAHRTLSVQVHPDDAQARAAGDSGKVEAWLVLAVTEGARIVRGFRAGVTREQFAAAVASGETAAIEELLHMFTPRVGDCVFVPPGTVHAIGPGVVIFEVQQNSDLTYRLYDWGRPREMHVEAGLAVTRLEAGTDDETVAGRDLPDGGRLLVECDYFRLRRYRMEGRVTMPVDGRFLVVTVLRGQAVMGWHSGGDDLPLHLRPGDCALVSACVPEVFLSPIGALDVVLTDPGRG